MWKICSKAAEIIVISISYVSNVPCNVFLLDKYPEHLLDLPFITEYKNSAEHPYVKKSLRKNVLGDDDFTPASAAGTAA